MRKCALTNLDALLRTMAEAATVYLPVDGSDGRSHFTKWEDGVKMSEALNTVRSAKDFFFPQTENLVDFKMEGKTIEVIDIREECEDFVIFGVRACDVRSFEILDRVFLADPVDSYYASRREHGIIVSMACNKPSETCFCRTFGIDAAAPGGDVVCYKTEGALYLDALTEKGQALLAKLDALSEECDSAAAVAQ